MSAFVVDKKHIDVLVRASRTPVWARLYYYHDGKGHTVDGDCEGSDRIGQMLWDECVRSVSYRYPHDSLESLPGRVDSPWLTPYSYPLSAPTATPVEVLKAIACYEYQSCEHPGWEASEAFAYCQALRSHMIAQLPGYEDAPWTWEDAA